MPRIKFGSRIRKSFRRKGSGDTNDEASLITEQVLRSLQPVPSDVSTSSLCSDVRDHGPIDVDDCKKYKNRRGKVGNKKVYDRSRKENNLPRISEGGSSTTGVRSRPATPVSASGSRPVTPVTHIDGVGVEGKPARRYSPGEDQTGSTLNGKDVFERNRSSAVAVSGVGSVAGSRKSSRSVPVAGPNSSKISSRSQPRAKAASPKARGLMDSMAALVAPTENTNAPRAEAVNGLDVFERSRLALDSFGAKPPTTPRAQPRHGSGSPIMTNMDPNAPGRAPYLGSNKARNASPSFVISPRAASPSLASMFSQSEPRSTTTNSARDSRAVSDEVPLKRSLTPARRDKYDASRDKYDGPGSLFGATPSSSRPKSIPTDPSPTGVVDVFHAEFPVEFDEIENKETDKYSLAEAPSEKGGAAQLMSSKQKPPALPLSKRNGVQRPPKNNRLRPAKASHQHQLNTSLENVMAAHAARGLDNPDVYTSLEDAMAAHAAMLTNDAKGKATATGANRATVKTPSKDFSTDDSVCSNVTEVLDSARPKAPSNTKNTTTSPEFCTKKKNAEKGEFKKVVMVKKKDGKTGLIGPLGLGPQEAIEVQATRKVGPFGNYVQKEGGVKDSNETSSMQRRDSMDPPGIDKTNTKSPVSPNPLFVEDTLNTPQLPKKIPRANTPRPKPVDVIATKTKTVDEVPQQAVGGAGADLGQSFSFELGNFDVGVQHSLSDDGSYASYYSELESIDSITICEETTRLLEMRDRYEKDAHTNKQHPSRIKPSIMKAGSIFRTDSVNAIKDGKKAGYGRSSRSSSAKVSTNKGQAAAVAKRKLTWYDDEENWNKPFTLRTDESFDGTTISSDFREMTVGGIIRTNVVGEFFGDFMKGIGLPTCGGEEDVASVDPALEQEI